MRLWRRWRNNKEKGFQPKKCFDFSVVFITSNLFTHQKSLGESTQPKKDIGPHLIPIKAATSTGVGESTQPKKDISPRLIPIKAATSTRKTSNQTTIVEKKQKTYDFDN
ncbi:hypothetical protein NQZ68_002248 [Dissostichus eleginoides]|uniref:Cytochrome P450 monooxygenase vrtE n=1 Tax=Dissostichus eleginoides TaxID=100907 RepID=A0AAD9B448_DISEL|nr:hypothetical protein NQZ68_002248 [Dissostichus eleginoides]KAK1876356.1 Cytochrome P450 monooxygenase vrtE [Dissostichus eleginoides]